LLTLAEVESISGEQGNFEVELTQHPRYVDMDKCIACGLCTEKCPRKAMSEQDAGLTHRKAIYVKYAQAVPLKYVIDAEHCIYFKKKVCKACEKFCPTQAIRFDEKPNSLSVNVGAVILASGAEVFDPAGHDVYGYGKYPNVITSVEFERILSASGPFQGHLVRPSDHREPKRIAWLQCVGSRDINQCDNRYCSAVCCMYAIKEALVAREHSKEPLDCAVFFMDMRTYGKGFERYYENAKDKGIRFVRSRVHSISRMAGSEDLEAVYVTEDGRPVTETFNLIVLSVGIQSSRETRALAAKIGVELDRHHFAATTSFAPVSTSIPGIFVCGVFQGPKDIPASVMEASAAAAAAARALAPARGTLVRQRTFPAEVDVRDQRPCIGVFVCNCGVNIGGVVRVPEVVEYAKTLANVVYAQENLFSCSQDAQDQLRKIIAEQKLNRVVVAACSPRTHEPLFQQTLKGAGINKYLFEMANIRDQDSWVHQNDPDAATDKAKDLVRMAVAKASLLEPLQEERVEINQSALVVGGGIAGMNTALALADQGFGVHLVEERGELGGQARRIRWSWKGEDVQDYVRVLVDRVENHGKIHLHLNRTVVEAKGFVGNFQTKLRENGGEEETVSHGVTILATGAEAHTPEEYLYGKHPRIFRWHDIDSLIADRDRLVTEGRCAVFIQCVGSREPHRPYCSKICCTRSIVSALKLKELNPDMEVFVLYRDIRTYGTREDLYQEARTKGIVFIRFSREEKPRVEADGRGALKVIVTDHILGRPITLTPDFINLATAIVPRGVEGLSGLFRVPVTADGFFLEAHAKLRPVDFASDGVFVCGLAHYPKSIDESIAQALAAASRATTVLSQEYVTLEPTVSRVDQELCIGCGLCQVVCPFGAIDLKEVAGKGYRAESIAAVCKGCGVCAAACPQTAIDMLHFRERQLVAAITAVR
jgi:heterodisulfide reductase subunit A